MLKTLVIVFHPSIDTSVANKRWLQEVAQYPEQYTIHDVHRAYPDGIIDVAQEQAGVPREPVVDAGTGEDGSLAPARGIVVGVLLSAVIWAALALALWALTRH